MLRVSTSYQYGSYTRNIANAQQRYLQAQDHIGTGKRIHNPSDDPVGTASIVNMRSMKAASERYQKNISHGEDLLKTAESSFDDVTTLMRRAYQLAVQGANGATDQQGREAMVTEIVEIQKRLVDLGNTRGPNNEFVFSGQAVDTKPFTTAPPTLTYNGDANSMVVETAPGETMAVSVRADTLFVGAFDALESLKNNLQGGNTGAISGVDIQAMQNSLDAFAKERGKIGSKLQQLSDLDGDYQRRIDDFTQGISDVEDVDMAEAIMEYQLAETAYTAALNVASQGFRLSLMDFIQG